MYLTAKF